jgi:hypothetical protein
MYPNTVMSSSHCRSRHDRSRPAGVSRVLSTTSVSGQPPRMWVGLSRATTVTFELFAGSSVVSVAGPLDYAAVQPCRAALKVATDGRSPIVFDLFRVAPPGAVSVALLGAMRRYVSVRGAVMTLTGVPGPWRSALERARVWDLYEMASGPELMGERQPLPSGPGDWIGQRTPAIRPLRSLHGRLGGTGPDPSRGPPLRGLGAGCAGGDPAG